MISELDIEFSDNIEPGSFTLVDKHLRIPAELTLSYFSDNKYALKKLASQLELYLGAK